MGCRKMDKRPGTESVRGFTDDLHMVRSIFGLIRRKNMTSFCTLFDKCLTSSCAQERTQDFVVLFDKVTFT